MITEADRTALGALSLADVGLGVYLIGAALPEHSGASGSVLHAVVGIVALLLAMPAAVAAVTGRLPAFAHQGVLVNVGALAFMAAEVVTVPADVVQGIGLGVVVAAATFATGGLYVRMFRRRPAGGDVT
jgi:hypothetical protein